LRRRASHNRDFNRGAGAAQDIGARTQMRSRCLPVVDQYDIARPHVWRDRQRSLNRGLVASSPIV